MEGLEGAEAEVGDQKIVFGQMFPQGGDAPQHLKFRQPVVLVDFCAANNAKIPITGAAFGVCGVKNRPKAGF
jgi:hypothetical protein